MRDRETDSWWSIMTSKAIGGSLDGADLIELPVSEKTTWKAWREAHPKTRVLSIEGIEHIENNPYDNYFTSEGTFRDLEISDERLAPKAPIFSFWIDGQPVAVAHEKFEGGAILTLPDTGERVLLGREVGAPIFASSQGYLLKAAAEPATDAAALLSKLDRGESIDATPLSGFDTFWYNWVSVNPDTLLLE